MARSLFHTSACPSHRFNRRSVKVRVVEEETSNALFRVKLSLAVNSGVLDLSESQLKNVPPEIFELSNLSELSLSGNRLQNLPREISKLTNLTKLQLAGNELSNIPEEIGALTELRGLWIHGNFLETLPESFGDLQALQKCSLSGNKLQVLPASFSKLRALVEFAAAGNLLKELPDLEGLEQLRKLTLHGNLISSLTTSILFCLNLRELSLQGNELTHIHAPYCFFPQALKSLNLADNQLSQFDIDVENLTNLEQLTLYGNHLKTLPKALLELPRLQALWLEGNPLDRTTLDDLTSKKRPIKVGLDQNHLNALNGTRPMSSMVTFSHVPWPYWKGYFKLVRDHPDKTAEMLVIAFGSGPGTPNWGSLLRKVKLASEPTELSDLKTVGRSGVSDQQQAQQEDPSPLKFDILFVVDPCRSWYNAAFADFHRYADHIREISEPYRHCLMIGDSMGATASLMFSELATYVLSFCPQVDLRTAAFRPASSIDSWKQLKRHVTESVDRTAAHIHVVTGTWTHDLDQVKDLDRDKIQHTILQIDSHRLTAYLQQKQRLVPFVQRCIEEALREKPN